MPSANRPRAAVVRPLPRAKAIPVPPGQKLQKQHLFCVLTEGKGGYMGPDLPNFRSAHFHCVGNTKTTTEPSVRHAPLWHCACTVRALLTKHPTRRSAVEGTADTQHIQDGHRRRGAEGQQGSGRGGVLEVIVRSRIGVGLWRSNCCRVHPIDVQLGVGVHASARPIALHIQGQR